MKVKKNIKKIYGSGKIWGSGKKNGFLIKKISKLLTIAGSGSGKTNALINLISRRPDTTLN